MEKDFFFNNSRKVIINSRDNGMMSKSLTFYLLNHYQGVIILVCVCVCVICIYIYSLYNCTMVINLSHLISQILIFLFTRV